MVTSLPMRESVNYSNIENGKWTAGNFKGHVDSHANYLLDLGFTAGDTIAVWLDESPERVCNSYLLTSSSKLYQLKLS